MGGHHLLALTRLGIGHFHIADYDYFEIANFNRQAGAMVSTIGMDKAETMARMARDINPSVKIDIWSQGLSPENLGDFYLELISILMGWISLHLISVQQPFRAVTI